MENLKKNLVLIGFMGCGKTTLGRKLAARLSYEFIDTDKMIETEEGMAISDIFALKGEPYFRTLEKKAVIKLSGKKQCVIATGGGIIKKESNVNLLSKNGIIIYLKATPEHIYRNIGNDKNRPLLQGGDKMTLIRTLLEERIPAYEKYAEISVDVTGGTVNQITDRIVNALEGKI